jgi:hypothetical protein
MRQILTLFLLSLSAQCFCQTDRNGNPVFNSVSIKEDSIDDFKLVSNYWTLKGNIDHKGSSAYISKSPTFDEISSAAINLPSDFFLILKEQTVINVITVINQPKRKITVLNPGTGILKEFKCSLKGDITENRANEIINEKYDSNSIIRNNKLIFNKRTYKIISNQEIKQAVLELITKEDLSNSSDSPTMKVLSNAQLRTLILGETKEGGKLDFFTPIKGKEFESFQIKPNLIATNREIAFYKWGKAVFELGVNTLEDALSIFSEFKERKLNIVESSGIQSGFERSLEK